MSAHLTRPHLCVVLLLTAFALLSPGPTAQADPPAAPTNLSASGGETVADLAWDSQSGVTFTVYRSTTSGTGYTMRVTGLTANGWQDTGLGAGTYYYVVTAVADGESGLSNEASASAIDTAPPAPVSLDATVYGGCYTLYWSLAASAPPDLAGFNVCASWTGSAPWTKLNTAPVLQGGYYYEFDRRALPRGTLTLTVSSVDATEHETWSTETKTIDPVDLQMQEPKRNPTFVGGGHTVSASGGEFRWIEALLSIPVSSGFGFQMTACYRSNSARDTVLGHGWCHSYEQTLTASGPHFDRFDGTTGRTDRYTWNTQTEGFDAPAGAYDRLEVGQSGTATITDRDGTVATFTLIEGSYRLTGCVDRNGRTLGLTYDDERITTVTDSQGRDVSFDYKTTAAWQQ